jgi:hypothetical protein
LNPNIGNLLKDKRFLIAAGIVAAVGLVVLVRKQKSGANPDADTADGSTPTKGAFDTTGTDMASWISEYTADVLAAIQAAQQNSGNGGQTTPPPSGPVPYVPVPRMPSPITETPYERMRRRMQEDSSTIPRM